MSNHSEHAFRQHPAKRYARFASSSKDAISASTPSASASGQAAIAAKGIRYVFGFPKDGGGSEVQSVKFAAVGPKKWSIKDAKKWLKAHGYEADDYERADGKARKNPAPLYGPDAEEDPEVQLEQAAEFFKEQHKDVAWEPDDPITGSWKEYYRSLAEAEKYAEEQGWTLHGSYREPDEDDYRPAAFEIASFQLDLGDGVTYLTPSVEFIIEHKNTPTGSIERVAAARLALMEINRRRGKSARSSSARSSPARKNPRSNPQPEYGWIAVETPEGRPSAIRIVKFKGQLYSPDGSPYLDARMQQTGVLPRVYDTRQEAVDEAVGRPSARRNPRRNPHRGPGSGDFTQEEVDQLVQMEAETSEQSGWKNAHATEETIKVCDEFEDEVMRYLEDWCEIHPGCSSEALFQADAPYAIFMTIEGHGVGIWDGRWNGLMRKDQIDEMHEELRWLCHPTKQNRTAARKLCKKYQAFKAALEDDAFETGGVPEEDEPYHRLRR